MSGIFEVLPKVFEDERGYFSETYRSDDFKEKGLQTDWVQENQSFSRLKNTIRGLHFQSPPYAQTKLIRVPRGRILDVFVDIRVNSPTFGHWDAIEVSEERRNAVYVSKGFAHGFCTLENDTLVQYKVDSVYSRENEGGILWNDPQLSIDWNCENPLLSGKDRELPLISNLKSPFV
ncbi:MAG: dTDP-4-dehydrorhamnose 3,5-epimerase [Pyrinomonadaceae bacterium]